MQHLEVMCGSYDDCLEAFLNGAKSIILASDLSVGGLTPSLATLMLVKRDMDIPVYCMVRPRPAGFNYQGSNIESMFVDAQIFLDNEADGIVFGFLDEEHQINQELTMQMVDLIHSYNKDAIFNRAIDVVTDLEDGITTLIKCGVDRVITSGGSKNALLGIDKLTELVNQFQDKIIITPTGGINVDNARDIINHINVPMINALCSKITLDQTTSSKTISFDYLQTPNGYMQVDANSVKQLVSILNENQ